MDCCSLRHFLKRETRTQHANARVGNGVGGVAVGVVHQGVEALVNPLPKNYGACAPAKASGMKASGRKMM